jgi:hypothetical protein
MLRLVEKKRRLSLRSDQLQIKIHAWRIGGSLLTHRTVVNYRQANEALFAATSSKPANNGESLLQVI